MRSRGKLLALIALIILGFLAYRFFYDTTHLRYTLETLKKELIRMQEQIKSKESVASLPALESRTWTLVQSSIKDAVVQVFSEVAEFNWLEPYKSPNQYVTSGSGFFINQEGDFITNAHVVDQAKNITIQIPSFGKRRFDAELVGVSPDRELALLRLNNDTVEELKQVLGKITVLPIGDSDLIHRSEEIMAVGYPLGQQSLKSTTGVVSGQEHVNGQLMIQISAPINPGSSGGPSINCHGEVIGVNTAGVFSGGAQNVGYIIPSNELKLFLRHLDQVIPSGPAALKLLRRPFLGILFNPATDNLARFLHNPLPAGLYVAGTQKGSPLDKAGIKAEDMIYEIDGYTLDAFGEMNVPWSEDKVSVIDYIARLTFGDTIHLLTYRAGASRPLTLTLSESELPRIRRMFPGYETVDYEVFGGLVVMPLSINHLPLLVQGAPELTRYMELQNQMDGALVVTHVLPSSPASRSRTLAVGSILKEVNRVPVKTLDELRAALRKSDGFITLKTQQHIFAALSLKEVLDSEKKLSNTFLYPVSESIKELMAKHALDEIKKPA